MFTTGQLIFGACFLIAFVIFMIYSYQKDAKNHQKYYGKTALYVAIILIIVFGLLYASKYIFTH